MNTFLKVVEYILDHPALVLAVGGTFWSWVRRKDKRADDVLTIAGEVYQAVEGIFVRSGPFPKGKTKWERFAELFFDSMKARGYGEPSAKEMNLVKLWIESKANAGHR